jgi:aminoglycoside phosphotransferase (APT) family kinase protein
MQKDNVVAIAANQAIEKTDILQGLHKLAALPAWLVAAMDSGRVIDALRSHVPEFASGALAIERCKPDRVRLKGDRWETLYLLTIAGSDAQGRREVALAGTLTPPDIARADQPAGDAAFGSPDWRCHLPELRLDLWTEDQEPELEALPILTNPDQARAFLEQSIRAGAPSYADMRIAACQPKVMRNKPGRCTVLYRLTYDQSLAKASWPDLVIGKTYSKDKGQNAYIAMRKLWESPLSKGDIVSIAEPLAYVAEQKVLVQGPVHGDHDLKDQLRTALRAGTPQALDDLQQLVRKAAAGLAALHQSGARHGETLTWEDELAEIRGEIDKLSAIFPWFAAAVAPLLARLEALASTHPAEPALPAHRSFRPQQVLIQGDQIGFIDFDGFCLAEPALDIALFRATAKEFGINTSPSDKQKEFEYPSEQARQARLAELDAICDRFLAEYERQAPISRQRVALWEALDLLTVVLRCWTKVKPHQLSNAVLMLESQLSTSGLLAE